MKFIREVLFIFLVAVFFAGLTAGVNQALTDRISLNDRTRDIRHLLNVLDIPIPQGAGPETIAELRGSRIVKETVNGRTVYRAYDENGNPSGYAFRIGGKGFWGRIDGLLALDDNLEEITGIVFTSHNETPGLGARIEEPAFRNQFKGIDLSGQTDDRQYVVVTTRDSDKPNAIDAITGASMTSMLVEKFLNEDIRQITAMKDDIRRTTWPSPQRK